MTAVYGVPKLLCDDCGKESIEPWRVFGGTVARSSDGSMISANERDMRHFCSMECLSKYCQRLCPPKSDIGGIGGTGER